MRLKHKKIFISGVALTVAGVLGVGALLQSSVSVQASSAMMPGIEQIVGEVSEEEPFQILEIVDSKADAEIGYYVSGQEPYIKLYEYQIKDEEGNVTETIHFSTLEEGLSKLPSGQLREEFARNVKFITDDNGNLIPDENGNPTFTSSDIRNISDISYKGGESESGDPVQDYPLSYTDYEEKYFFEDGESTETGWNQIDFVDFEGQPRVDKVSLAGTYVENPSGNGNYTKQEQSYYPIRNEGDMGNDAAKFRENIQNFFYSEGDDTRAPYDLKFEEVSNATVNDVLNGEYLDGKNPILEEYDYAQGRYGYYENVYADLTTELADKPTSFPGEKTETEAGVVIQENENLATTELFSAGDAELFGSAESGSAEPDSGDEIFGADAVGDEVVFDNDTDVFSDDVFTTDPIENNEPVENIEPAENSAIPDVLADGNEDDTVKEPTILGEIQESTTAGTQSNPYIYLGKAIDEYPNYKYTKVGDLAYVKTMAEKSAKTDKQNIEEGKSITRKAEDITIENDQYWYWEQVGSAENDLVKQPLSVVTGRQPVAYNHIRPISGKLNYNYYYRVEQVYFCCKLPDDGNQKNPQSYQYFGWYFPSYPANESVYLPIEEGRTPTHYISDAVYKLTPGNGNYDFVPGGEETCEVEVNHAYYRGGYVNNDWLKRYVFHLSPTAQSMNSETAEEGQAVSDEEARKQFDNFAIEVDTFTAEELNAVLNGTAKQAEETYQAADPEQTEDEYQASDTEQMESGETADADQTENGDQVSATDQAADENQTEEETQAPDENQTPDEDQTSDETQGSGQENGNADTYADEVMVFGEGEVSQVEPMVSEVMEELVGPQADQLFSDSDGQTQTEQVQTEQTQAEQTQQTQAEQEPDADSLFSDAENTEPEETFSSDDAAVFSSGSEAKDAENDGRFQLSDYDLIYINGKLISQEAANALAESGIPCIINQDKMIDTEGQSGEPNSVEAAFFGFLHEGDEDGHYVNQYVYFFKNTFGDSDETAPGSGSNLVNVRFHTPFYTEGGQSTFSDSTVPEVPQGFEEIRDYIDSENQYRGLEDGIEPLSYDISQARVVEYILNYKLKRITNLKKKISVLEIQPAVRTNKLNEYDVLDWLGVDAKLKIEEYCCQEEQKDKPIKNIIDNNNDTIWHSQYNPSIIKHTHYFKVELPDGLDKLTGIYYLPRQDSASVNGTATRIKLEFYDEENKWIDEKTEEFTYNNREKQIVLFEKPLDNVKHIKVSFAGTKGDTPDTFASCAEFGILPTNIEITSMTSSEFVGHIEDLNTKYDIVYVGGNGRHSDAEWAKLINGQDKLLYSHVGAAIKGGINLQGLMEQDISTLKDGNGKLKIWGSDTLSADGIGSLRGSGNDITRQQVNALIDFAKSGYPVVIDNALYKEGAIDKEKVDNSSYFYDFLTEMDKLKTSGKSNVCMKSEAAEGGLIFFANLPKPGLDFEKGYKPNNAIGDADGPSTSYIEGSLDFKFNIIDEGAASPVDTSYDCQLFADLNCDGNFSNAEQLDGLVIKDASGNILTQKNGKYELKLKEEYTVSRKIPSNYTKLITWKLKIVNNKWNNIWTTETGYAKQKVTGNKPTIKVLQVHPSINTNMKDMSSAQWILSDKIPNNIKAQDIPAYKAKYYDTDLFTYLETVRSSEFDIEIESITVDAYVNTYVDIWNKNKINYLDGYDMLILGFSDMYQNITNKIPDKFINDNGETIAPPGAVDAIFNFIQEGKSVLFAHDTTSFINRDNSKISYNTTKKDEKVDPQTNWGYSMNSLLRPVVGMDRYGITSVSIKDILTKALELVKPSKTSDTPTDWEKVYDNQFYTDAMGGEWPNGDMAFQSNSAKTKTWSQTQGYSNCLLFKFNKYGGLGGYETTRATKVNEGAITEYPFKIPEIIDIAKTHGQYYQLAMEEDGDQDGLNDIIVWYCLGGSYRTDSPNDVRNNYYLYSKGNVMYTGVGHSNVKNAENNSFEKKLFVNAIVASYRASVVDPQIDFVSSFSRDAAKKQIEYFMLDQPFAVDEENIVDNSKEFYFTVNDYNLIASSNFEDSARNLELELFVENPEGTQVSGIDTKVSPLNVKLYQNDMDEGSIVSKNSSGNYVVKSGNVYAFRIEDLKPYVKDKDADYKNNVKIYAKVSTKFMLYGKETSGDATAVITLKQRQLFDLD